MIYGVFNISTTTVVPSLTDLFDENHSSFLLDVFVECIIRRGADSTGPVHFSDFGRAEMKSIVPYLHQHLEKMET